MADFVIALGGNLLALAGLAAYFRFASWPVFWFGFSAGSAVLSIFFLRLYAECVTAGNVNAGVLAFLLTLLFGVAGFGGAFAIMGKPVDV